MGMCLVLLRLCMPGFVDTHRRPARSKQKWRSGIRGGMEGGTWKREGGETEARI